MTEAEAKTKWCPMVGLVGATHPSGLAQTNCMCVASACMMWRWNERPEFVFGKSSFDMSNPDKVVSTEEKVRNTSEPTGYCGLAGKP